MHSTNYKAASVREQKFATVFVILTFLFASERSVGTMAKAEKLPDDKERKPWKSNTFKLKTTPEDKIEFKLKSVKDEKCDVKLELKNEADVDLAVKVKCTDNEHFKIKVPPDTKFPSAAIMKLEKGESASVLLRFVPKTFFEEPEKKRKGQSFAIFHLPMGTEQDPRKVAWAKGVKDGKSLEPQKRMPIVVTVEGGEPKKEAANVKKQESKVPDAKKQESKVDAKKQESKADAKKA